MLSEKNKFSYLDGVEIGREMMLAVERQQRLLELVKTQGFVRTVELQREFGVSHMTVRRDLMELEHRGLIRRVRGGAASVQLGDIGYGRRERMNRLEKEAIGRSAAELVHTGEAVFIGPGTTCIEVARHLRKRRLPRLFLVTTSVKVASEVAGVRGFKVTQLGGEIYDQSFGVVGESVVRRLARLRMDWAFLGTCGVDLEAGLTNNNHFEIPTMQAAIRSARRTVFVADGSKLGRATIAQIAPLEPPCTLITAGDAPAGMLKSLCRLGWEVIAEPIAGSEV